MSVHHETEPITTQRRTFLGITTGLIGASITGFLGLIIARFAAAPAVATENAQPWLEVGPIADIPDGKPAKRNIVVKQRAGWGEFLSEKLVWVVKNGQEITVFTAVCPHLGCTVNAGDELFICACHNSKWNVSGHTLSGPTPRGLDVLEHRVENGVLKVNYLNFKQGVSQKEVLS